MFIIVKKACWILWEPSRRAYENWEQVIDSKMVGKRVVFNLQIWDTDTAAEVLKLSFY